MRKTTLELEYVLSRMEISLDLKSSLGRRPQGDPQQFLSQFERQLEIFDEIHRTPELFSQLRGLIDDGRRKGLNSGRFLIWGSASSELLKQSGESLAGRIEYVQLDPFNIPEVGSENLAKLWLLGGFPLS